MKTLNEKQPSRTKLVFTECKISIVYSLNTPFTTSNTVQVVLAKRVQANLVYRRFCCHANRGRAGKTAVCKFKHARKMQTCCIHLPQSFSRGTHPQFDNKMVTYHHFSVRTAHGIGYRLISFGTSTSEKRLWWLILQHGG